MRIISGNFKGKKIYLPIDKETRPLRDLVNLNFNSFLANFSLKKLIKSKEEIDLLEPILKIFDFFFVNK